MQAVFYESFGQEIRIEELPEPNLTDSGVIIRPIASGICRSDWHGWMGHDTDIRLPHVPGHEMAGVIKAVGKEVRNFRPGDRVTLPFCCGCGKCKQCRSGNQQICDDYFQPGFTAFGCFADLVHIPYAETNLVRLPEAIDFTSAAILGCRFITSWRGIVDQGRLKPGQWIAVHGCGGVGLSAIMIAKALGALPIAIDIADDKLELAWQIGAVATINSQESINVPEEIKEISKGGVSVSVDALGHTQTCLDSILCLQKQGRHIQIGLMTGAHAQPPIPMGIIIAKELELLGSHGMQAYRYPPLLDMILKGQLAPKQLLGKSVSLKESPKALMTLGEFPTTGLTVIDHTL